MKLIDLSPLQDESGQISLANRIQGTLKNGFSWYAKMEAQKKVAALLNRALENRYTLIRNAELGNSGIVLPLILIGPAGTYVIEVTELSGSYQARGDNWGTLNNNSFQPAQNNLIKLTASYAKVLQSFFAKQGAPLPAPVEPILLAANPGLHVESIRPNIRVIMSDAIDRFAAGLTSAAPVMSSQIVNEFVERIQKPRAAGKPAGEQGGLVQDSFSLREEKPRPVGTPSRMRSILNAPKSDELIEKGGGADGELGFAFDDPPTAVADSAPVAGIAPPDAPRAARSPASQRIFGMTPFQIAILAIIFFCWLAVMGLAIYLLF